jgi:hypothetical protein
VGKRVSRKKKPLMGEKREADCGNESFGKAGEKITDEGENTTDDK